MNDQSTIWIVLPTYNEVVNISSLLQRIFVILPGVHCVVVDDHSPDKTANRVRELSQQFSNLHLIERQTKLGIGSAYRTGFQFCLDRGAEIICEMDADFSHPPEQLPILCETIRRGFDVAIGSRRIKGGKILGWGFTRQFMSKSAMNFSRWVLGLKTKDVTSGFKAFRRPVIESWISTIKSNGYAFQEETIFYSEQKGFKIQEIPIVFSDRSQGKSKLSKIEIFRFFVQIIKLWFHRKRRFRDLAALSFLFWVGLSLFASLPIHTGTPPHLFNQTAIVLVWLGFVIPLLVLYGLCCVNLVHGQEPRSIKKILGWTFLMALPLLLSTPLGSSDIYLYAINGRMISEYGLNPFQDVAAPLFSDPFYSFNYYPWLTRVTSYGPGWIFLSSLATSLTDQVWMTVVFLKFLTFIGFFGTVFMIWMIASKIAPKHSAGAVLLFAWNPVLLFEYVQTGHNDIFIIFFLLLAWRFILMKRPLSVFFSLILGFFIKSFILIFFPLVVAAMDSDRQSIKRFVLRFISIGFLFGFIVFGLMALFHVIPSFHLKGPLTQLSENDILTGQAGLIPLGLFIFVSLLFSDWSFGQSIFTSSFISVLLFFAFAVVFVCLRIRKKTLSLERDGAVVWFGYLAFFAPVLRSWYGWGLPFALISDLQNPRQFPWRLMVGTCFLFLLYFTPAIFIPMIIGMGFSFMIIRHLFKKK